MSEGFCVGCGKKRVPAVKFCANCGLAFGSAKDEIAAATATVSVSKAESDNPVKIPGTIGNVLLNITLALLLLFSQSMLNRYMEWGGDQSPVLTMIAILAVCQILTLYLQKRRKSFSLLLPMIASFISVLTTVQLYQDFKLWLSYQGYQTQEAVMGDIFLLLFLIGFYAVITLLNLLFIFVPQTKK